jgi:hypothetical protein
MGATTGCYLDMVRNTLRDVVPCNTHPPTRSADKPGTIPRRASQLPCNATESPQRQQPTPEWQSAYARTALLQSTQQCHGTGVQAPQEGVSEHRALSVSPPPSAHWTSECCRISGAKQTRKAQTASRCAEFTAPDIWLSNCTDGTRHLTYPCLSAGGQKTAATAMYTTDRVMSPGGFASVLQVSTRTLLRSTEQVSESRVPTCRDSASARHIQTMLAGISSKRSGPPGTILPAESVEGPEGQSCVERIRLFICILS